LTGKGSVEGVARLADRWLCQLPEWVLLDAFVWPMVGEVPTKRSSDHDPIIRHCRMIGLFEP
jgi:hypothetical protein